MMSNSERLVWRKEQRRYVIFDTTDHNDDTGFWRGGPADALRVCAEFNRNFNRRHRDAPRNPYAVWDNEDEVIVDGIAPHQKRTAQPAAITGLPLFPVLRGSDQ